ncbi:hypothetical protein [Massilia cavernae]|uniref:hypothetical protein n=1 Tax=Massilia cavernae TaxID=2320864 RepID=UPI0011C49848|nr:hypothetical protein [Massilia cavernae]
MKKRWLWLMALAIVLVAAYGALGIVQGLSAYQDERLLMILRFLVLVMLFGAIGAGISIFFAIRFGNRSTHVSAPAHKAQANKVAGLLANTRFHLIASNVIMGIGLGPIAALLGYIAVASRYRGDAAMGAAMIIIYGYGLGCLVALLLAFPASIWSYWLYKTGGLRSRWASGLRASVILVVLSPLVIFAGLAVVAVR